MDDFVTRYNEGRLHIALDYIPRFDKLAGRHAAIFTSRDRKLAAYRTKRRGAKSRDCAEVIMRTALM